MTSENCIAFQYRVLSLDADGADGFEDSYRGAEFMTLSGDAALLITDYYETPKMRHSGNPVSVVVKRALQHKYAKSGLSDVQLEEFKYRLEYVMKAEQAFLRSDLTLPQLAASVNCSVNHLSQVINSEFGMSFFDYLNKHRIEYAKNKLGNYEGHHCAILKVECVAGCTSTSVF